MYANDLGRSWSSGIKNWLQAGKTTKKAASTLAEDAGVASLGNSGWYHVPVRKQGGSTVSGNDSAKGAKWLPGSYPARLH